MDADLVNKVLKKLDGLVKESTETYREKLNANVHVLDFSYTALKISSPDVTQAEYDALKSAVASEYSSKNSLKSAMSVINDPSTIRGYTVLVEDPEFGTYILSKSYESLQRKLSGILKKLHGHVEAFTGTDSAGKTVTNIGHISAKELNNARSPLELKLLKLLKAVPIGAAQGVLDRLNKLHNAHTFTTQYHFQREDFNLSKFKGILGSASVLVTLQTSEYNNALSIIEKSVEADVRQYVRSSEFVNALINTPGSNSIIEDFTKGLQAAFSGKKVVPGSSHSKKKPVKATTKVVGKTTAKKVAPTNIPVPPKPSELTSLPALLAILNFHLHDVVAANMGDGSETKILNYRTGRFATSTKVERLSMSRQGMVTAFYSYMKNPYATFSAGGRQSHPVSRDPKLLISKSIREIAATVAVTKLRSVNV